MAFTNTTGKLSELSFSSSPSSLSLSLNLPRFFTLTHLFLPHSKPSFRTLTFSSLRTSHHHNSSPKPNPTAPWLAKTASPPKRVSESATEEDPSNRQPGIRQNPVERIVLRLRNLGLVSDEDEEAAAAGGEEEGEDRVSPLPVTGEEKLGELLRREWVRPDAGLLEDDDEGEEGVLPWQKEEEGFVGSGVEEGLRRRMLRAPSLAELTLEDELLRRLRREGMRVRERISIPKAGLTKDVMDKIHEKWRKEELVRLKFHEELARNMKIAHEIVERRTGGLVTWRSGSIMMVYRGINYQGPPSTKELDEKEGDGFFIPDVSSGSLPSTKDSNAIANSSLEKSELAARNQEQPKNMTEEEAEYNALLDGLGPRFVEWWGTGVLPVDADLLPRTVPGYKTPFRLLPAGMRSRLTNAEMTNLRKLAKSLPCHFSLGRNRNHQGLACAILKLWEKSLLAKIAIKRGIQNTNNKLMADELKTLTGGTLLLRNKYYIVIYRGKDFVPTDVAAVLAERQELTKQVQDVEEKVRCRAVDATSGQGEATTPAGAAVLAERQELTEQVQDVEEKVHCRAVDATSGQGESTTPAGSLAEFYEAKARWGRDISTEEREKMKEEVANAKTVKLVRHTEHKLSLAQAKKLRAEKLLAKIEAAMVPGGPDYDQETITEEERVVFRRIGLRMKAYLPLGIRGVFDGVIENMHLHWKHRELVKLISKQKTLAFVEDTARLLEYESGGILVAIERVSKGFALIYYRGKNYKRPITLRPRNLLTKQKALKRSIAMQRHEALSQHITELEKNIDEMNKELSEDEDSDGFDDEEDSDWDEDEDAEFPEFNIDGHP
ncbi:CRM-domain containing factor CFM3, chloroplastic/mitochondrial isoform X2 [Lotus japonicus]|uniref:CRM-domain containing factor CFM3, chloroplastic/mitochondrial isoform X2 n=1 Tax=Lotus japonicus TaxID=34305 RepID=UPI00258800DB|nr:CRM-domain containing factor CFM3, chloroplastic/mitochondrial isoform X2 [Lotus japonicus]